MRILSDPVNPKRFMGVKVGKRLSLDCDGSCLGLSSGSSGWVRFRTCEREASYMFDGDLNMQIRPIQNVGMELCHMLEVQWRDVLKLRKIDKRYKELTVAGQQPESVPGDQSHIHFREDFVWAEGFHLTAPGETGMFILDRARA
jgi:hypothetical protein